MIVRILITKEENHFDFIQIMNCWFSIRAISFTIIHYTELFLIRCESLLIVHSENVAVFFFAVHGIGLLLYRPLCVSVLHIYTHTPDMATDGCYYKSFARQCAL